MSSTLPSQNLAEETPNVLSAGNKNDNEISSVSPQVGVSAVANENEENLFQEQEETEETQPQKEGEVEQDEVDTLTVVNQLSQVQLIETPKKRGSLFNLFGLFSSAPASNQQAPPKVQQQQQKLVESKGKKSSSSFTKRARNTETGFPRRIFTEGWDTKPPCAVIVTIFASSSYDALFRDVQQQSPDEESSIAVFQMDYNTIPLYLQYVSTRGDVNTTMMPQATIDAIKDVVEAIDKVEPESVVFNFECCSHCSESGFSAGDDHNVMELLQENINRGFMTMFGDFSVKALIATWDPAVLGPAPFDRESRSCSSSMLLAFDSAKLLECPSAQLQNVGKLHEGINTAELHCLSGTVVFSLKTDLDAQLKKNPAYSYDVLTIATKIDHRPVTEGRLSVDRHRGHAGHVLLTYNNEAKGKLLVSAGHWIELSQMGAETERVFSAMREQYGADYEQQLRQDYESAGSEEARSSLVQKNCRQLVQSSAPCKYSKKKA
jgi:hypothetical protein